MCSNSNKGVLLFPQCRGNSNEDHLCWNHNLFLKIVVELLENVIQALDSNSKLGEGRLTVEQKYMKHSNVQQRSYATKNAHDIKHSTNPPSVVFT